MGRKVRSDSIFAKAGRLSELANSAVLDITGHAAELAISGSAEKKDGPLISRTARSGKFREAARLFGLTFPLCSGLEETGATARASIGTQPAPRGNRSWPFLVSEPNALASAGAISAASAASRSVSHSAESSGTYRAKLSAVNRAVDPNCGCAERARASGNSMTATLAARGMPECWSALRPALTGPNCQATG